MTQFAPTFWNDQISYWHEALTFITAGFDGGYYATDEHIASIPLFHFGSHGPFYAVFFGSLGKVFGWQFYTPIIINALIITTSLGFLTWKINPSLYQLFLIGCLVITYSPLLSYIPIISQESFHQSAAIILAALFYRLFNNKPSYLLRIITLLLIIILTFIRFTWGVLLIPFFILSLPKTKSHILKIIVFSLSIFIPVFILSQASSVIWSNHIAYLLLEAFHKSILFGVKQIFLLFSSNISFLLNEKNFLKMGILIQSAGLLLFIVLDYWKSKHKGMGIDNSKAKNIVIFHLFSLGVIFILVFLLYIKAGAERILGTALLLSTIILIKNRQYIGVYFIIILNILLFPRLISEMKTFWSLNTRIHPNRIEEIKKELSEVLIYQTDAESPWCNTILISLDNFSEKALAVPGGIGISFIMPGRIKEIEKPLKSRFLMINAEKIDRLVKDDKKKLVLLHSFEDGTNIYQNLESHCSVAIK